MLILEIRIRLQTLIGSSLVIYSDLPGTFFISLTWLLAMWGTAFLFNLNLPVLRLSHSGILLYSL